MCELPIVACVSDFLWSSCICVCNMHVRAYVCECELDWEISLFVVSVHFILYYNVRMLNKKSISGSNLLPTTKWKHPMVWFFFKPRRMRRTKQNNRQKWEDERKARNVNKDVQCTLNADQLQRRINHDNDNDDKTITKLIACFCRASKPRINTYTGHTYQD